MQKPLFDPAIPVYKKHEIDDIGLERLKDQFKHYDPAYVANACFEERRVVLEEAYNLCHEYLDDDFTLELTQRNKFQDRIWELCLCSILINNGYQLEKLANKNKGRPDFCILIEGKRIWIEAVCPNLGDTDPVEPPPILKPGEMHTYGGEIMTSLRPRAVRVSSVLTKKYKKREAYIKAGVIKDDEPYLVAINTYRINHHISEDMLEELVLLGMGLQVINMRTGDSHRQFIESVKKMGASGSVDIPMALFHKEEYKNLPAVIFFKTWFDFDSEWKKTLSDSAVTYINHQPSINIDPKIIKFGAKKKIVPVEEGFKLIDL